jgi:hypothetical protein
MRFGFAQLAPAACLLMLSGCFLAGESYQPVPVPAQRAVVYVYRPYSILGSQDSPMITCGRESIEIEPGAYHAFVVDTGPLACSAGAAEVKLEARAGEQYFIREHVPMGLGNDAPQLTMMSAKAGQDEIQDCSKQVAADSGGATR